MRILLGLSRIIVGVLFIFSGLIKANDPLGLSYKMQEFFEIWGWHALNDLSLAFSVAMIGFEIIAGIAVLLGWQMRLFSWLLLLLTVFFTFLTGYAVFSGKVRECGCFGDCIPLTAEQSFGKDLVLLVLILFIFAARNKIKPFFPPRGAVGVLLAGTLFAFGFQWYVLTHLPVLDCLPYKQGKNIPEQMKVPAGAIPDSTVISFMYTKNGKPVEFTADKFPDDFNDTDYQFVKRYDKLIRKGNAVVPIKDFALGTISGNDTTEAILSAPGYTVLLFTKGIESPRPDWLVDFLEVQSRLQEKNIPLHVVTSDFNNVTAWLAANKLTERATVLKCDFVAIKTAARANPSLYLLNQGNIVDKWSYADFDKAALTIQALR